MAAEMCNRAADRMTEECWQYSVVRPAFQDGQKRLGPVHGKPRKTVIQGRDRTGVSVHDLSGKCAENTFMKRVTMNASRDSVAVESLIS